MYLELLCSLLVIDEVLPYRESLIYLSEFQKHCPYSSICGENASLVMPDDENITPCCKSCSCDPECKLFDNCCFDSVSSPDEEISVKCLSPVVSHMKVLYQKYLMIDSCSTESETLLCDYDVSNITSYSPVVSQSTGAIYVNGYCASCNGISDMIPWQLAIQCTLTEEYMLYYSSGSLYESQEGTTGCYQVYLSPEQINLDSRVCATEVIRKCNVTREIMKWEPFWDYCPLFNATFSTSLNKPYGNIFCFLCNSLLVGTAKKQCYASDFKSRDWFPFTVLLENKDDYTLLDSPWEPDNSVSDNTNKCREGYAMVKSFRTECRKIICPYGQFRVGGRCGYYSKQWTGGPYTVVLKLTPANNKQKMEIIDVRRIASENDTKATWLKRVAMKNWNIDTLYRTDDCKYIEYLIVLATYPYRTVNPTRLWNKLVRTLEEIWHVNDIELKVELSRYQHYMYHRSYTSCSAPNVTFGYTSESVVYHTDDPGNYFLEIIVAQKQRMIDRMFLNDLFLCEQIKLYDEEFEQGPKSIFLKSTNDTLYETAFMVTESASVRICLDNFPVVSYNNSYRLTDIEWLPFFLLYWLLLTWK